MSGRALSTEGSGTSHSRNGSREGDHSRCAVQASAGLFGGTEFVIGAHSLRATAATNALARPADIAKGKDWLGIRHFTWRGVHASSVLSSSNGYRGLIVTPSRAGPLTGDQQPIPIEDCSTEEFAALCCGGPVLPRDAHTIQLVPQAFVALDERTRLVLMHTVLQRQHSPKGSCVFRRNDRARYETWHYAGEST